MKQFIPLSVFAAAFALVEAAVVVYTRMLYYPDGFSFPLVPPPEAFMRVEIWRELATLVMLGAAGTLAGKSRWERFAFFLWAFGLWDLFYYVWLKVFIGWPAGLLDPDILFLVPALWWGPVLAPCIVALSLCLAALIIVRHGAPRVKGWHIAGVAAGAGIILYTFMADAAIVSAGQMPPPYRWGLFWAGWLPGAVSFALSLKRR